MQLICKFLITNNLCIKHNEKFFSVRTFRQIKFFNIEKDHLNHNSLKMFELFTKNSHCYYKSYQNLAIGILIIVFHQVKKKI